MKSYQDKDWLYQKYIVEKKSTRQITKEIRCSRSTIRCWLKKFNIPKRTLSEANKGKIISEKTRIKMSKAHKGIFLGEKNPNWKGGQKKVCRGYILIYKPNHPYADSLGCVRRSRLVMEKILGRYLTPEEVIHHKNKITDDDRPENLKLFESQNKHVSFHNHLRKKEVIKCL